ncbi:hypothetical protein MKW98_010201, partial [Papaver atlanticum]
DLFSEEASLEEEGGVFRAARPCQGVAGAGSRQQNTLNILLNYIQIPIISFDFWRVQLLLLWRPFYWSDCFNAVGFQCYHQNLEISSLIMQSTLFQNYLSKNLQGALQIQTQ